MDDVRAFFLAASNICPKAMGSHVKSKSTSPGARSIQKRPNAVSPGGGCRTWWCGADAEASALSKVFDPGIDEQSEDGLEWLLDAVRAVMRQQGGRPISFREGEFLIGTESVNVCDVLFDTGVNLA